MYYGLFIAFVSGFIVSSAIYIFAFRKLEIIFDDIETKHKALLSILETWSTKS
jgi:hypothetical protein